MNIEQAKKIMGGNFIGPEELSKISSKLGIGKISRVPKIPFSESLLKKVRKDAILILGVPVSINTLRRRLGINPRKLEPCFYNQDWYIKEKFANKKLKLGWYLVSKDVKSNTRAKDPDQIKKTIKSSQGFPSAVLCAYTFFAYYFHTDGKMLWKNDMIWCIDRDKNVDQIYVGQYIDPKALNKNGFNIHRHLSIKPNYGLAPEIIK
jgi:hypothetical protein